MKKILSLLIILTVAVSAFSIDIVGNPPTTTDSAINTALGTAFDQVKIELNEQLGGLKVNPENLIRAFGNASVYASQGATQRSFGGYKTFAVTLGPSFGLQSPVDPFEITSNILAGKSFDTSIISSAFKKGGAGDLTLGANLYAISAQIGFNTSFLLKNLYLGFRIGFTPDLGEMFKTEGLNFSFNNFLIGATANYQLIPSISLFGLITWRGVNIGSGLIIQSTKLGVTYPLDEIRQQIGGTTNYLVMDPSLFLDMKITTVTIPVEAMTAIKLLFINIPFGVGADFAFGESSLGLGMKSGFNIEGPSTGTVTPGSLTVSAGGKQAPTFANLKLMTGIGFCIGPVLIDIPLTWYFADKGMHVGFTFGVAF